MSLSQIEHLPIRQARQRIRLPRHTLLVQLWCGFKTALTQSMFAGGVGGSNPRPDLIW